MNGGVVNPKKKKKKGPYCQSLQFWGIIFNIEVAFAS